MPDIRLKNLPNKHKTWPASFPHTEYANRDSAAIRLKLDKLIRCTEGAHNDMLNLDLPVNPLWAICS